MAKKGDVVVVTINYRLGPFANLFLPDAHPNVGMLDQILALEWVKQNIENFGGDPNNITIFGESAGAAAVATLMAMPKVKGLFQRGIPQSGAAHPLGYTKTAIKQTTEFLLDELKLNSDDLEEFRKISAVDIIKATFKLVQRNFSQGIRLRFGPYVDGQVLPKHPLIAIDEGYAKDIDLIIGSNFEESKFWHMFFPNFKPTEEKDLSKRMKRALKLTGEKEEDFDKVITTYKNSREEDGLPSSPQDILDAYNTDHMFRIPAVKFADAQSKHQKNTYMYMFSWGLPNMYGAMHGLEIGFVFNMLFNLDIPTLPKKNNETEALSENMMNSWVAFAKNGVPNHKGIPNWPEYETQERYTIVFDKTIKIWKDPLGKERQMWENMNLLSRF
jgi:para-nitrobenzyl esterase